MSTTVVNQPEQSRYALLLDGELVGIAEYELRDDAIAFVHTQIDDDQRGKGFAGILIRSALDDVRDNTQLRVIAECPYVRRFLREHPDYAALLRR